MTTTQVAPLPPSVLTPPPEGSVDCSRRWRLADLDQVPDENGFRYEIIDGVLIVTPAPNRRHGGVAGNLIDVASPFLRKYHPTWYLMTQPINLEVETEETTHHCEPDLSIFDLPKAKVIADEDLFPVIVIEIVSPSNPGSDYVRKVIAYATLRIPEYWIVDPRNRAITYLQLDAATGQYNQIEYSVLLPELTLSPDVLFAGIA